MTRKCEARLKLTNMEKIEEKDDSKSTKTWLPRLERLVLLKN